MVENVSTSYTNAVQNQEKPYPFLSKEMTSPDRKSAFLTDDKLPSDRPSPFLTKETVDNAKSPFLENKVDAQKNKTPLDRPKIEEKNQENAEIKSSRLPMNDASIISELKRNPLRSTMTIMDIANDFNISYMKAMYIYKTANEDANGIVKEFKLPDKNATVSYLV